MAAIGLQETLYLGNIYASETGATQKVRRNAMADAPAERGKRLCHSTGEQYTVKAFVEKAAEYLDMKLRWEGEGIEEVGYLDDKLAIRIDPKYYRPAEVETLLGDPSKAKKELHWSPKITFDELVYEMITSDLAELNGSAKQSMQE